MRDLRAWRRVHVQGLLLLLPVALLGALIGTCKNSPDRSDDAHSTATAAGQGPSTGPESVVESFVSEMLAGDMRSRANGFVQNGDSRLKSLRPMFLSSAGGFLPKKPR